jgi:hypothetical protein
MNYKDKYLKYKNKYLNLKQHAGAMDIDGAINQPIYDYDFTIYTTGIAYHCNMDDSLIARWHEPDGILENILRILPLNYRITIAHSDILEGVEGEDKQVIEHSLNQYLGDEDPGKDPRIVLSTFTTEELDFNSISTQDLRSYIIIDIAHIFTYTDIEKIVIYNETNYRLNVVNIGFPNDLTSQCIFKSDFFRVLQNGDIVTYIDKMIQLRYQHNIDNLFELPENIITITLERLRRQLNSHFNMEEMIQRFGEHDLSERWLQIKREVGGLIILLLFDNITYDVLYGQIYDYIQTRS